MTLWKSDRAGGLRINALEQGNVSRLKDVTDVVEDFCQRRLVEGHKVFHRSC